MRIDKIDSQEWISAGPITIGAVTTAPTKGTTRTYDNVRYRKINSTTYELEYKYAQVGITGAAAGDGSYLFSLPAGITWGSSVLLSPAADSLITSMNKSIPTAGQILNGSNQQRLLIVVPYNSTQFRMIGSNVGAEGSFVANNYYGLTTTGVTYKVRFYVDTN